MPNLIASGRPGFGSLLREHRLAAGLSQEALAELATLSVDGISALERGANQAPQRDTLALLVNALGLNPEQQRALEIAAARPSRPRRSTRRKAKQGNLPRVLTRLYGRERELGEIKAQLKAVSLITLTGAGGVGKTRLALEVGSQVTNAFDDGVWFVDLAVLHDPNLVANHVAALFGVSETADRDIAEALTEVLSHKSNLVILDNCEHVAPAVAYLSRALITACPDLRILATSRQTLQVPGEQPYRVASLSPAAAMELFADSASRAVDNFAITEENAAIVERICTRLDGIALAIELAAARLNVLSPAQLEERLSERFRVLTGGSRLSLSRHQTMRALVDWSYDLLDAGERKLFTRLAVFPASFSLEAVYAVCADEHDDEPHILEVLASLIDKSLVISEPFGATRRYRLLETMRAYALEKSITEIQLLNRRHAEFYNSLVARTRISDAGWGVTLDTEYSNIRRALEWTIDEGGDVANGALLLERMREFLLLRGLGAEAARRAERALACSDDLAMPVQALLWAVLAAMRAELMQPAPALKAATRALALYEELRDRRGIARALRDQGVALLRLGDFAQAERDLQRALTIDLESGEQLDKDRAWGAMALVYKMTGRLEDARTVMMTLLETARATADERSIWINLQNLAETEFALGEVQSAVAHLRESLAGDMVRKNARFRANAKANLAAYLLALDSETESHEMASAAVREARQGVDRGILACAIQHLAAIRATADPKNAARLLGYVEQLLAGTGFVREYTERYTYDVLWTRLREKLADDEIAVLSREGGLLTEEQAVRLARRPVSAA
jgi:predicted ATPase